MMESKANKERGDSEHALIGQIKKGRGKGLDKGKMKSERQHSFMCHKNDHCASQYLEKKGKGKQQQNQVATSIEIQMDEFVVFQFFVSLDANG